MDIESDITNRYYNAEVIGEVNTWQNLYHA